jgi:hypothetical protein
MLGDGTIRSTETGSYIYIPNLKTDPNAPVGEAQAASRYV